MCALTSLHVYVHVLQDVPEMTDMHTYRSSGVKPPHSDGNGPRKGLMLKGEGPGSSLKQWKFLEDFRKVL